MAMSPEFRKRLNRAKKLFVTEMIDGCNDCTHKKFGACDVHKAILMDFALHPAKYLTITPTACEYTNEGKKALGLRDVKGDGN